MMVRYDTVTSLDLFDALAYSLDDATHFVTKYPACSITSLNFLQVCPANAARFESDQNLPSLHLGLRNCCEIYLVRIPEKTCVHERNYCFGP